MSLLLEKEAPIDQIDRFLKSTKGSGVLVLSGPEGSGKTLMLETVTNQYNMHRIDLMQCVSINVLLKRLGKVFSPPPMCFADLLGVDRCLFKALVFDHVDQFELDPSAGVSWERVVKVLGRLGERFATKVIFVTRMPLLVPVMDQCPVIVSVNSLSQNALLTLSKDRIRNHDEGLNVLCPLLYSVLHANGHSLHPDNFLCAVAQILPLFIKPLNDNPDLSVGKDSVFLFKQVKAKLVDFVEKGSLVSESVELINLTQLEQTLLIACHLCRLNSVKHEVAIFGDDAQRRKRLKGKPEAYGSLAPKGQKAVSIHRLIAVFYHIYGHEEPGLNIVLSALRGLFDRKLLLPLAVYERTDGFKIKCNVGLSKLQTFASELNIDFQKYTINK